MSRRERLMMENVLDLEEKVTRQVMVPRRDIVFLNTRRPTRANLEIIAAGKKSGTGLGAYSARLMAETQGGAITVTTSDEEGTAITIELPSSTAPVTGMVPNPAQPADAAPPAWPAGRR